MEQNRLVMFWWEFAMTSAPLRPRLDLSLLQIFLALYVGSVKLKKTSDRISGSEALQEQTSRRALPRGSKRKHLEDTYNFTYHVVDV